MEDVVIVGAGPYGLSTAAHLATKGRRLSVFGTPMQTWRTQMPSGMHLKSEGFASRLYDPRGEYPLARFCQERGIPYADIGLPVARQTFADYGQEFARRYVPMLEDRTVTGLRTIAGGFELELADGQMVEARRVVCAVGITHYAHVAAGAGGLAAGLAVPLLRPSRPVRVCRAHRGRGRAAAHRRRTAPRCWRRRAPRPIC